VDILTLTATPIPRTLNLAMSGLRELSIIATPPSRRLAVKTFVQRADRAVLFEAITRELRRGGQVYFLHNEVRSIERRAREISELVPEARLAIAHGQLREAELERVMSDFYHKRSNVLCCSTIIEPGIDVPSANTIIIDRADRFGLAQLHQLRGRVGRSHHQAYAYLLVPESGMTADAEKRLAAIAEADTLGAGFLLATHDLEIRGAGELLGEEQSGQIESIGFNLYMDMLERAVAAIRAGQVPDVDTTVGDALEINLRLPALIPEDYLPDAHHRLVLYKRIANAASDEELRELQVEMIDRFGLLPDAIRNLFQVNSLRLRAQALGLVKIEASERGGLLEFSNTPRVDPLTLVELVQSDPVQFRLDGGTRLRFGTELAGPDKRIAYLENLLGKLAAPRPGT
jgi:transcription-repair coupling factor (superfamily II helicase)